MGSDRFKIHLFFFISTLIILSGIGLRGAWPADEPRFVEVVREMLSSGHWLVPMRGGEYYPDKPPLFFWLMATISRVTGSLEFSFLMPSALAGMATLWMVFDLARRLANEKAGLLAATLLLLTPQFLMHVKSAQIDALVMCWITLGCYGLLRHFVLGPNWTLYFMAWVAMGLGVITKGVGFLPLLMLIPIALSARIDSDPRAEFRSPDSPRVWMARGYLGPVLMLLVIATWLLPLLWQVQLDGSLALQTYRDDILLKQTAKRYVAAWHHLEPWHFFVTSVMPTLWLPVVVLLAAGWPSIINKAKASKAVFVLLGWVICVLVFFSLSSGKRAVYILPALPMLSLALALVFHEQGLPKWFGRVMDAILILAVLLCTLLALMLLRQTPFAMNAIREYTSVSNQLAYLMLLGAGCSAFLIYLMRRNSVLSRLMSVTVVAWLSICLFAYPLIDPYRKPDNVFKQTSSIIGPEAQLGLLQYKESFLLYSPRDLVTFGYLPELEEQERNAWQWIQRVPNRYLLVASDIKLECFNVSKGVAVGATLRKNWLVLDAQAGKDFCPLPQVHSVFSVPVQKEVLTP